MTSILDHFEMVVSTKQTMVERVQEEIAILEKFRCEQKIQRREQETSMEKIMKQLNKDALNVEKTNAQYNSRVGEFVKLCEIIKEKESKAGVALNANQSTTPDASTTSLIELPNKASIPTPHRHSVSSIPSSQSCTPIEKELAKLQDKSEKLRRETELAEQDYRMAVQRWAETRFEWEDRFTHFCNLCQQMDEERLSLLHERLGRIHKLTLEVQSEWIVKAMCLMAHTVTGICPPEDSSLFIQQFGTGSNKPPLLSFVDVFTGEKTIMEPSNTRTLVAAKREAPWRDRRNSDTTIPSPLRASAMPNSARNAHLLAATNTKDATGVKRLRETWSYSKENLAPSPNTEETHENTSTTGSPIKLPSSYKNEVRPSHIETRSSVSPLHFHRDYDNASNHFDHQHINDDNHSIKASSIGSVDAFSESSVAIITSSRDTSPHRSHSRMPRAVVTYTAKLDESFSRTVTAPRLFKMQDTNADASIISSSSLSSSSAAANYLRSSIKMEGWLKTCDDLSIGWVERWATLEGGYLWFFRTPEDNQRPMGLNKPLSMLSVKNNATLSKSVDCCTFSLPEAIPSTFNTSLSGITPSSMMFSHQQYCSVSEEEMTTRVFCLLISNPRPREYVFIPPTIEELQRWIDALQRSMKH